MKHFTFKTAPDFVAQCGYSSPDNAVSILKLQTHYEAFIHTEFPEVDQEPIFDGFVRDLVFFVHPLYAHGYPAGTPTLRHLLAASPLPKVYPVELANGLLLIF